MLIVWLALTGCASRGVSVGGEAVEPAPAELSEPDGLLSDGRLLSQEERVGRVALVMHNPRGRVLWEREFPVWASQPSMVHVAVSPDEEQVVVSAPVGGGLVMLDMDGNQLWQTDVVGRPSWSDDMSSLLLDRVDSTSGGVEYVRIDPRTGVQTGAVAASDVEGVQTTGMSWWVDGAWHLIGRNGPAYRLIRYEAGGALVRCAGEMGRPHPFVWRDRTLVVDDSGHVMQWQACEVAPEPVAVIPPPGSTAGAGPWLEGVAVVDGTVWVMSEGEPGALALTPEWTWREPVPGR